MLFNQRMLLNYQLEIKFVDDCYNLIHRLSNIIIAFFLVYLAVIAKIE